MSKNKNPVDYKELKLTKYFNKELYQQDTNNIFYRKILTIVSVQKRIKK